MSDKYREVSPNTIRIGRKYCRLSSDLVVDGAKWVCIDTDEIRRRLFFRMVQEEEEGAVELKFPNDRKSPLLHSRPRLSQLGIAQHDIRGIYEAASSGCGALVVDLTERLIKRGGQLKVSKRRPRKNPYQFGSAAFEALRLCLRPRGATLAEIGEIARKHGVNYKRLVRSVLGAEKYGYRVIYGPGASIRITAPRRSDQSRNRVKPKDR
jgi:hypothetical protein